MIGYEVVATTATSLVEVKPRFIDHHEKNGRICRKHLLALAATCSLWQLDIYTQAR